LGKKGAGTPYRRVPSQKKPRCGAKVSSCLAQ